MDKETVLFFSNDKTINESIRKIDEIKVSLWINLIMVGFSALIFYFTLLNFFKINLLFLTMISGIIIYTAILLFSLMKLSKLKKIIDQRYELFYSK